MIEITLKQWIAAEAKRAGVSTRTVESRLSQRAYPNLQLRRLNRRVIRVLI